MPEPASGPLAGLTVIDLTRVLAGPYCTLILADLGARVIKIERPGRGDDARQVGPFAGDQSAYFASLNRGKQSLVVDPKRSAGLAGMHRLLPQPSPWHRSHHLGRCRRWHCRY